MITAPSEIIVSGREGYPAALSSQSSPPIPRKTLPLQAVPEVFSKLHTLGGDLNPGFYSSITQGAHSVEGCDDFPVALYHPSISTFPGLRRFGVPNPPPQGINNETTGTHR